MHNGTWYNSLSERVAFMKQSIDIAHSLVHSSARAILAHNRTECNTLPERAAFMKQAGDITHPPAHARTKCNSLSEQTAFARQAHDIAQLPAHVLRNGTRHNPHTELAAYTTRGGDLTHPPVHVHGTGFPRCTREHGTIRCRSEWLSRSTASISHIHQPMCCAMEESTIHIQGWRLSHS